MKKVMFMVVALVFMASNMNAQESSNKLHFGVKVGANYANVYDSQEADYDAGGKFGLAGGAFVSIPIGTYFGIQPELLFSQRGFKASGTFLGSEVSLTRTSNYIDVPILFAVKPDDLVTIFLGPQYSYLISQKDVVVNPISDFEINQDFDTDNIRKNTLCLVTGFDVNLEPIVLSARVGWDLFDNNGDGTSTSNRYKNVWGQATVGFRF